MITEELFQVAYPTCKQTDKWVDLFNKHLPDYGITDIETIASFMAQTGHESMDLNVLEENLNYSEKRLLQVFPKYFKMRDTAEYAHQPEKIANVIYAARMGNGTIESGDGWRFRGRGIIQLTGRNAYLKCSEYLYGTPHILDEDPDLIKDSREAALLSALWYWQSRSLNQYADNVETTTKLINGGLHGLDDRMNRYKSIIEYL